MPPNPVGFRYWKTLPDIDGPHLLSLAMSAAWSVPGVTHAAHLGAYGWHPYYASLTATNTTNAPLSEGLMSPHPAPYRSCLCGLYAWRSFAAFQRGKWATGSVAAYGSRWDLGEVIAGAVIAGGHIVYHGSEGFRAAQARPIAFGAEAPSRASRALRALADAFGVPVLPMNRLEAFALELADPERR